MIIVSQERRYRRDRYVVTMVSPDGETVIGEPRIVDPVVTQVTVDGFTNFLLRSTDGISDDRFYDYMNVKLKDKPIKTRLAAAAALRRFYCFLEVYRMRMEALTEDDWTAYESFLLGRSFTPWNVEGALETRSVQTVNAYLVFTQKFLRQEGIHYEYLEEETVKTSVVDFHGVRLAYTFTKNVRTLRGASHEDEWAPMHVSPAEFLALLEVVNRHEDTTALMLVKLMYFYGMRLGECLGLTQEDVVMCASLPGDSRPVPMLRLRNRPTDAAWQRAKNLPVMTRSRSRLLGPRTYVLLTESFFGELQEYIQDTFSYWTEHASDRLPRFEATVLTDDYDQDANWYLFRNSYGAPLTDAAWNARLRGYFVEAGIPVDGGRKRTNLSHRLRHGCAMLLFRYLPKELRLTEDQLRRFLRHKRLESTRIYSRPTVYEEFKMLEAFQQSMAAELPFINDGYEVLERERYERWKNAGVDIELAETLDVDPLDDIDISY